MIYEVQTVKRNFQLELKEEWQWNDETGQTVAVRALHVNEFDDSVKVYSMLIELLEGEQIDLRNPINLSGGCIDCDVFLLGQNVIDFLREG